jgi:hypothetical protein
VYHLKEEEIPADELRDCDYEHQADIEEEEKASKKKAKK